MIEAVMVPLTTWGTQDETYKQEEKNQLILNKLSFRYWQEGHLAVRDIKLDMKGS